MTKTHRNTLCQLNKMFFSSFHAYSVKFLTSAIDLIFTGEKVFGVALPASYYSEWPSGYSTTRCQ